MNEVRDERAVVADPGLRPLARVLRALFARLTLYGVLVLFALVGLGVLALLDRLDP